MGQLALVGDFCPNPDCVIYGDTEAKAIIKNGKTRQGRQRFQYLAAMSSTLLCTPLR